MTRAHGAAGRDRMRALAGAALAAAFVLVAVREAARPPCAPGRGLRHDPVDLNRAGRDELAILPRVGPALAAAIVADREANGPFRTVDELDRVRGVGPATLARLRPHVGAGPAYAVR